MRTTLYAFLGLAALVSTTTGCDDRTCGTGTIERGGKCVPADETVGTATCGPDTMLVGDRCVSTVVCDPSTTTEMTDPATGMIVCVGTGGASGCGTCPSAASSSSTQTLCGQIYDFETNTPFASATAKGGRCDAAGAPTDGPCALRMDAFDAVQFAMDQSTTPLQHGDLCIDDMGRYVLKDIQMPSGPFIGLGIDDKAAADMGPGGVTNATGVSTPVRPGLAVPGFEAYIVKASTTTMWASTGGPTIATGYYVPVYRAHCVNSTGNDPQCAGDPATPLAGVQFTRMAATEPANTFYFQAAETQHRNIDTTATMTGANGTALVNNASVGDSIAYSGQGALTDTTNCKWEQHAGATLAGIVTIQIFRPMDVLGKKCAE